MVSPKSPQAKFKVHLVRFIVLYISHPLTFSAVPLFFFFFYEQL